MSCFTNITELVTQLA